MAVAASFLAGCEKESDNAVDNSPVAARITSAIDGMGTRAAGTAWAAGDAIGINGTSGTAEYKNVKYVTTSGDGVFTPDGGAGNNIYFQDKDEVTFTAYYPHYGTSGTTPGTDGTLNKTIAATDQDPDAQPQIDFLFATAIGSSAKPNVQFQFKHCMSRLVLNFQPGDGISSLSDIEYTLYGLLPFGTFNTTTGEAKADINKPGADLTLTVPFNTQGMSSSPIVYPQQKDQADVTVFMGGMEYKGTITFPQNPGNSQTRELLSGYAYTYNIKVNKSGLTISKATISEWTQGGNPTDIPVKG